MRNANFEDEIQRELEKCSETKNVADFPFTALQNHASRIELDRAMQNILRRFRG